MWGKVALLLAIGVTLTVLLSFSATGTVWGPDILTRNWTRYEFFGFSFELPFYMPEIIYGYRLLWQIVIWVIVGCFSLVLYRVEKNQDDGGE